MRSLQNWTSFSKADHLRHGGSYHDPATGHQLTQAAGALRDTLLHALALAHRASPTRRYQPRAAQGLRRVGRPARLPGRRRCPAP